MRWYGRAWEFSQRRTIIIPVIFSTFLALLLAGPWTVRHIGEWFGRATVTPTPTATPAAATPTPAATPAASTLFYVYQDADSPGNHFTPTGYMGDTGDIKVDEAFRPNPHSGSTCIRVAYTAAGRGPGACQYARPCGWAGVYWQHPPNNWGTDASLKGKGFDLTGYNRLRFWARADSACSVEFKVGGIGATYGDSLFPPRAVTAKLDADWREFEIDLTGAPLKHIIGGFCWVANRDLNPGGATFYLDDIRFETR